MGGYTKIVRDSAGAVYAVRASDNPRLAHVYVGVRAVRRAGGRFEARAEAERLIRRIGCTVVAEAV